MQTVLLEECLSRVTDLSGSRVTDLNVLWNEPKLIDLMRTKHLVYHFIRACDFIQMPPDKMGMLAFDVRCAC